MISAGAGTSGAYVTTALRDTWASNNVETDGGARRGQTRRRHVTTVRDELVLETTREWYFFFQFFRSTGPCWIFPLLIPPLPITHYILRARESTSNYVNIRSTGGVNYLVTFHARAVAVIAAVLDDNDDEGERVVAIFRPNRFFFVSSICRKMRENCDARCQ